MFLAIFLLPARGECDMYSISDIARLSGITAFTLRYYEKIGVLPRPRRQGGKEAGIRQYDDSDLRLIRFIHGLKQTGIKLEDIMVFVKDGCLLAEQGETDFDVDGTLQKRIESKVQRDLI
ncbi:MerR family transcriptional regulator [Paenibacillus elgii]|uniref:MerR family transcriptional regulator n=1 Tax=Paenibacillus elgii TaxID=189691 RepID=UPI00204025CE|nr:MerR family transcriptional regulator [Paenibacillus elgii]MCM3268438.1 MerR family transcriptional regulator [Paenibacillus elgii]